MVGACAGKWQACTRVIYSAITELCIFVRQLSMRATLGLLSRVLRASQLRLGTLECGAGHIRFCRASELTWLCNV
jgi:hypothetical protein